MPTPTILHILCNPPTYSITFGQYDSSLLVDNHQIEVFLSRFHNILFHDNTVIRKVYPEEETEGKFHQNWD
jgi:hypothetical protein